MIYIVRKLPPKQGKMTIDDLLFGPDDFTRGFQMNKACTFTYEVQNLNRHRSRLVKNVRPMIDALAAFNAKHSELFDIAPDALYRTFYIPKRSGGMRRIDAPNDALMGALRELKGILEQTIMGGCFYHTNAFAYIPKRSTIDSVKRHQQNESRWFAKFDLHDFFGSTTPDFVFKMLSMIYPFSEIMMNPIGNEELRKALSLGFLRGGLPQGTPLSPTLTNIMMIPIDFNLTRNFRQKHFVYTRYADDFLVSSKYDFNWHAIQAEIIQMLAQYEAPFTLNTNKTRYGSRAGSNWNLGVMLNKDNQITVGSKNKKRFQAMLTSYALDKKNGTIWDLNDVQVLAGLRSYYKMVEGETIDRIVQHLSDKFGIDIITEIKEDLKR